MLISRHNIFANVSPESLILEESLVKRNETSFQEVLMVKKHSREDWYQTFDVTCVFDVSPMSRCTEKL